jgi:hypothetical protein
MAVALGLAVLIIPGWVVVVVFDVVVEPGAGVPVGVVP